jgi:hypothetical protein
VLISVLASLALAFGWIMITAQVFNTERTDLGINPGERLLSIFTDPLEFLKNLAVTLSGRLAIFYKQAVGVSGYGYWRMPAIVYCCSSQWLSCWPFSAKGKRSPSPSGRGSSSPLSDF